MRPIHGNSSVPPGQTWRLDAHHHRRIDGLFDLWLEHVVGGFAAPAAPDRPLDARRIADLVRRAGAAGDDVRLLAADGARHADVAREVAGLLGRDVLVTPAGSDVRHRHRPGDDDTLRDAIPIDRLTGQPVDWLVIQPPDLATELPGWFALRDGVVRPRTGVVALPMPSGLALATRADFTARRASVTRLVAGDPELATLAVTVRAGTFLVGDYRGTQDVYSGHQLAGALAELPLYGGDLRAWLTWPSDPAEQQRLAGNLSELAEATGATVWTPPIGGTAEISEPHRDLRALDPAGQPAPWLAYPPSDEFSPPRFRSDPDGRLIPAVELVLAGLAGRPTYRPEPADRAPTAGDQPLASPSHRPEMALDEERDDGYGVSWLPPRLPVNVSPFELYLDSAWPAARVARDGVPSPELFLVGRLAPTSDGGGPYLLRVRVEPGGATQAPVDLHVPAELQHLLREAEAYLLPAGRLDHVRLLAGYSLDSNGLTMLDQEFVEPPRLLLCSADARHGMPGLPNDTPRWPRQRPGRAYAVLPAPDAALPTGWLWLHHTAPAPTAGHWLIEVQVPERRAIDIKAGAARLAPLTSVRTRAHRLLSASITIVLPARSYDRVTVLRLFEATAQFWTPVSGWTPQPLTAFARRTGRRADPGYR